ncbi:Tyrosine kinase catalytic domain protein [Ceratobasidium sp. AG-Ba]|nr:Tyrosine kinase catalytic domain protein [Ceratobasidium sp. AG-Ba]
MMPLVHSLSADDEIFSVSVSHDGTRVAASYNDAIMIWDTHTGCRTLGPLKGHEYWVWSVAFSPDGRSLASGSSDNTIRIWDTETGTELLEPLNQHTDEVTLVLYSYAGTFLISGSDDHTVNIWDPYTGNLIGPPIDTGDRVSSVAISPDSTKIAIASFNNTLRIYDFATVSPILHDFTIHVCDAATGISIGNPFRGHTNVVTSVAFSPDCRYIASGSDDMMIILWDAVTGQICAEPLAGHSSGISAVVFTSEGSLLVSGSRDHSIKVWDVGAVIRRVELANGSNSIVTQRIDLEITSVMSLKDVVSRLTDWGCTDMSAELDWTSVGDYPISQGGFGDIYRCKLTDGHEVAVKTLRVYVDPDEQTRKSLKHAAREIYTWSKLKHPNVQPLLGLVVFREQVGMLATWEPNGNLPSYIERNRETDRCLLGAQIAEGLAYLHDLGVVHGDLKGVNVLVSKDEIAQLADFGNAVLREYTIQFSKTSTKHNISPRWTAPELFRGSKYSMEADVYALGMV